MRCVNLQGTVKGLFVLIVSVFVQFYCLLDSFLRNLMKLC